MKVKTNKVFASRRFTEIYELSQVLDDPRGSGIVSMCPKLIKLISKLKDLSIDVRDMYLVNYSLMKRCDQLTNLSIDNIVTIEGEVALVPKDLMIKSKDYDPENFVFENVGSIDSLKDHMRKTQGILIATTVTRKGKLFLEEIGVPDSITKIAGGKIYGYLYLDTNNLPSDESIPSSGDLVCSIHGLGFNKSKVKF